MNLANLVAAVLLLAVTAYAVLGGADFGAGFWDLVAGGTREGAQPRALINRAVGPVWEVNHVWLVFCLVVFWTAFPPAFGSVMTTLSIPLSLALLGIVLRGAGFAFRHEAEQLSRQRFLGGVFAIASVLTPFFFGTVIGGIASGRVPVGNAAGNVISSWLNPTSITIGLLAVAAAAYLAAVFLVTDAHRMVDPDLEEYFRDRAILAAVIAGLIALVGIFILHADDAFLFEALAQRGWPLLLISGVSGRCRAGDPAQGRAASNPCARGSGGGEHDLGLGRGPVSVSVAGVSHDLGWCGRTHDVAVAGRRRDCRAAARPAITTFRVPPRPAKST